MSPRPRSIADTDIITIAANVLARRGIEQTRLADVAAESGLAAATLVQRFGSRELLLDAVAQLYLAEIGASFRQARASPLAGLELALTALAVTRHLTFFAARPDRAAGYSLELRKWIAFSLAEAVEAGDIAPCEVAELARRIQVAFYGCAATALLENTAISAASVRNLIDEVIAVYH